MKTRALLHTCQGAAAALLLALSVGCGTVESEAAPAGTGGVVRVRPMNAQRVLMGVQTVNKIVKTDEEWRRQLTPEQYQIARNKGTERAFCGRFHDHKQAGIYACVCCGLPLFSAGAKFDSGTGWPSFFKPVAPENVTTHLDLSHGMRRTEVLCTRCDAHLGHVFEDGPPPTGLRYCLNSESLVFTPDPPAQQPQPAAR